MQYAQLDTKHLSQDSNSSLLRNLLNLQSNTEDIQVAVIYQQISIFRENKIKYFQLKRRNNSQTQGCLNNMLIQLPNCLQVHKYIM